MKKLKLFLCVALFGAMSFGAFSAYEHLTMSEEERFLLANIEALTQYEPGGGGDESWDCTMTKDQCTIKASLESDLARVNAILRKLGFSTVGVDVSVDLSHLTQLYQKGGSIRCGVDKTCYDVCN